MKAPRSDFTVRPNRQNQRSQLDLWDVILAHATLVTTTTNEQDAQDIADALNIDPYFLDRGKTSADRAKGYSPPKFESV